jgi:hypothetical protein
MKSLLEVAAAGNVGDVITAIYAKCATLEAKRGFHLLANPYFETILRRFDGQPLRYQLIYGHLRMGDGHVCPAYLLTMTRADHRVTKWAFFVNERDEIMQVEEQDPDLPTDTLTRH